MTTNVFLPSSDFSGDDNHRPEPSIKLGGGHAVYNGAIVFANVARTDALSLLPQGANLSLAANTGAHPDSHPVIHLHGRQTQTAWIINGQQRPVGNDYGEFMLLMPFVRIGSSPQWHTFVVRMYLEDVGAMAIGAYFGYRKRFAKVRLQTHTCKVSAQDLFNPFLWLEVFTSNHQMVSSARAKKLPNWPEMQAILSMPILGVDELTGVQFCSYFQLDFSTAVAEPIECTHDYLPAFDPAIPMTSTMTSVDYGAVDVSSVGWQIDYPAMQC